MHTDTNQEAFLELVRAGLWPEREFNGSKVQKFKDVDWVEVYRLAEEQSVVGLVAAGIDKIGDNLKVPLELKLQIIGEALQIEQQNKELNAFVAKLIEDLRKQDVYAILVKGQGVAQCYEKPLWRSSGDVDLLLSSDNYEKAKKMLLPLAIEADTEFKSLKHLEMTMQGGFVVELHGTFHSRLSGRVDRVVDEVQHSVFWGGEVRSWTAQSSKGSIVQDVQVFLPSPDNDVIFIFTHILKHFFIGGIGIRQICDWCRLLYTYKDSLNHGLLESRIRKAGLMTEWKAFAALAVDWLGMPDEAMPLFNENDSQNAKLERKAERIMEFVLESGNFGHSREKIKRSKNILIGKIQAAWFKMHDFIRHARLFPLDSVKFFFHYALNGVSVARDQRNEY